MFLTIPNVPNTTTAGTGTETRASARRFHVTSATVTVDGTVGATSDPATNRPLITNPHYCGAAAFNTNPWIRPDQKRFVGSGTGYAGSTVSNVFANYNVTCTTQAFNPTFDFQVKKVEDATWSHSANAGDQVMVKADFSLPDEALTVPNATIGRGAVQMPPSMAADLPSIGATSEQCGTQSAYPNTTAAGYVTFIPGTDPVDTARYCPPGSVIGTATIKSPLVPGDIIGRVYAVNAPVPNIGIWIDPSVAPTNPQGVSFGLYFRTIASATADEGDGSLSTIQLNMNSIPDVPVSSLSMVIGDNPNRGGVLGQTLLKFVEPTDPACRPSPEGPDANDPSIIYPANPDPWSIILRLRPWSQILSAADMVNTGSGDLFSGAPGAPLSSKDTERKVAIDMTGCLPHG